MSTLLRLTIADFDKMIAADVFDDDRRIELIRGELREMNPRGPQHDEFVERLTNWSYHVASQGPRRIRAQSSIGMPELDTVPEPDIVWLVDRDYSLRHPTAKDVLLLIEVTLSSLDYDTSEKADLYAEARIKDYWVVNLSEKRLDMFRNPSRGRYRQMTKHEQGATVSPLAFPKIKLKIAELFGTA